MCIFLVTIWWSAWWSVENSKSQSVEITEVQALLNLLIPTIFLALEVYVFRGFFIVDSSVTQSMVKYCHRLIHKDVYKSESSE